MYERIETRGGKPKFSIKQKLAIADEYAQETPGVNQYTLAEKNGVCQTTIFFAIKDAYYYVCETYTRRGRSVKATAIALSISEKLVEKALVWVNKRNGFLEIY